MGSILVGRAYTPSVGYTTDSSKVCVQGSNPCWSAYNNSSRLKESSMSNSNKIKAAQLGMPFGTASNNLRKQILFKYVQKVGDNFCYVCNEEIMAVDDLSIEHKERWLNVNPDLFWDLDNIAFSHLHCNKRDYSQCASRIHNKEDKAWCNRHKDYVDINNFYVDNSRPNGLCSICKKCR